MSEQIPSCTHVWMSLPSLNCKKCYECGVKKPIDANKPMMNLPGETK